MNDDALDMPKLIGAYQVIPQNAGCLEDARKENGVVADSRRMAERLPEAIAATLPR